MTAVNVFLQRNRALMMTDASVYTPDGDIVGFAQKAVAMPTLRAVAACLGPQQVTFLVAIQLPLLVQDFDELLRRKEELFNGWYEREQQKLAAMGHTALDIVVAGWSDKRDAPACFHFARMGDEAVLEEIGEWAGSPAISDEEDANLHSIGCEIDVDVFAHTFDPVRHGIPYMEAQRRTVVPYKGRGLHIVGGHIMVSEVTREGTAQRVIHRWNDAPGMPIVPEPFRRPDRGNISTLPLNRQQRRAMERQNSRRN